MLSLVFMLAITGAAGGPAPVTVQDRAMVNVFARCIAAKHHDDAKIYALHQYAPELMLRKVRKRPAAAGVAS